jgi:hypothetical protein
MRTLALAVLLSSAVLACGSHTDLVDAHATSDGGGRGADGQALDASDSAAHEAAALDAPVADDEDGSAGDTSCLVKASSYDQSCTLDTDCMEVGQVLVCPVNECANCLTGTININAAGQYTTAFSSVTAALPRNAPTCPCPNEGRPCCRAGMCQQCF